MSSVILFFRLSLMSFFVLGVSITTSWAMGPASVAEMAARLSGAVVNIGTSRQVQSGQGEAFPELPDGSSLRELFDEINPNSGQGEEALREARSLGSGFLVSAEGHIVTNNHVIEGADEILIYTDQGKRYVAEVVGADTKTDLAVLKISTEIALPFVEFGDSDTAEVGDWVMAIGNPFGLGGSVSLGIVSARNRNINSGPYDDFIQTDAAINLGNSGGPLFDMDGNVVGIVTAIIARGGSSRGIGFAVPVNLARPIVEQLFKFGETRRGWLGVGIQEVRDDIVVSLGLSSGVGALVVEVTRGGPSEGVLRSGDVILSFNGEDISETRDLPRIVAQTPVGHPALVQVIRDGEPVELVITLGQLELGEKIIAAGRQFEETAESGDEIVDDGQRLSQAFQDLLGFSVAPLTPELRKNAGFGTIKGLIITHVAHGSKSFNAGVRAGLVITEVDQVLFETIGQFEEAIEQTLADDQPTLMLKLRDSSGIPRLFAVSIGPS